MWRTLARCRKFEETGKSCFTEPALRDVIFATPPRRNDAESTKSFGFLANIKPEVAKSRSLPLGLPFISVVISRNILTNFNML